MAENEIGKLCDLCRALLRRDDGRRDGPPQPAVPTTDGTPLTTSTGLPMLPGEIEFMGDVRNEQRTLHADKHSFQTSLDQACCLCRQIKVDSHHLYRSTATCSTLYGVKSVTVHAYDERQTDLDDPAPDYTNFSFRIEKIQGDERLNDLARKSRRDTNTGHDRVLGLAQEWMSRCVDRHTGCVSNKQPPSCPTRLLSIQDDTVRLIDGTEATGPYVTLSHCWGKEQFKVLTRETLPEFKAGILREELPLTFREAMTITRRLGIHYIWIDSCCIVQASGRYAGDQLQEIAKMEEVYSNAILNIGAAASGSPSQGCFRDREDKQTILIGFQENEHAESELHILKTEKEDNWEARAFSHPEENQMFNRAWCLQERVLSPRMLHFTKAGIFWECNEVSLASEASPYSHSFERISSTMLPPFSLSETMTSRAVDRLTASHTSLWLQIVEMYSKMGLSRPEQDKLAALGGVAKRVVSLSSEEYVCGLFRQSLLVDLTWKVSSEGASPARIWRAPSWSWASFDGPIVTRRPFIVEEGWPCAEIIDVQSEPIDSSNKCGGIRSAWLSLKGWVIDIELKDQYTVKWGEFRVSGVSLDRGDTNKENLAVVYTFIEKMSDAELFYGLVLERVSTETYQRVGVVWVGLPSPEMRAALMQKEKEIIKIV